MRFGLFAVGIAAAVVGVGNSAFAQEASDGWHVSIGAGGVYKPEFKGSKDYEVSAFPFLAARYGFGDNYVALEGRSLRANLMPGDFIEAGPVLSLESGRDHDIASIAVRRLGEIDDAVNAGLFVRKSFALAGGRLQIGAEALSDTGEVHEGVLVNFGAEYGRRLSDRWAMSASVSGTWGDENYMQTYYGVSPEGAVASGLASYIPEAGVESVGVGATLRYRVSEHWGVLARADYQRLMDSAADSPIVAEEGSANQGRFALAVFYKF